MCRLNIIRMVVTPRPSHPFGINVIRYNVVVVSEFDMADAAFPVLLDYLPIQQFSHLCRGSEFPISSRVVRVLNALHAQPYLSLLPFDWLPTTTEK
jgi:hypothetical protein